jgi:hypothetical protein
MGHVYFSDRKVVPKLSYRFLAIANRNLFIEEFPTRPAKELQFLQRLVHLLRMKMK